MAARAPTHATMKTTNSQPVKNFRPCSRRAQNYRTDPGAYNSADNSRNFKPPAKIMKSV